MRKMKNKWRNLKRDLAVPVRQSYRVTVDYGRSVESGVRAGEYDEYDFQYLTSQHFPRTRSGVEEVILGLMNTHVLETYGNKIDRMAVLGYRPATIFELLALGEVLDFPDGFCYVALGSRTITHRSRTVLNPYIGHTGIDAPRRAGMCMGHPGRNAKQVLYLVVRANRLP